MGKKKEKIIYIDDGSTVADMSNLSGGRRKKEPVRYTDRKAQWETYKTALRLTAKPMLVVVAGLMLAYLLLYLLFSLM